MPRNDQSLNEVCNYGEDQTFTITPDAGSHVLDVKADAISSGPVTSYTFTNVISNHTISASFAINSNRVGGLPDTGQIRCYSNSGEIPCPDSGANFHGQDATYLINPPSYTKLDLEGNELPDSALEWAMVRDNVTGLIWEVKTDDGSIRDKDNTYNWHNAQSVFIAGLNSSEFGGHADWRLPTRAELPWIADYGHFAPVSRSDYFPHTISDLPYWSSTAYNNNSGFAWSVSFDAGGLSYGNKSESNFSVRAVRGTQDGSLNRFVPNDDVTVTDKSTGLMWLKETSAAMSHEEALNYCRNLSVGKHNDWRLPNIVELRSLVSSIDNYPAIDREHFPNTILGPYWSSTSYVGQGGQSAWGVVFSYGEDLYSGKLNAHYVRAVRGGQNRIMGHLVTFIPAQGSTWDVGDSMSILWETQGISGNVKISVSHQGGKDGSFETIEETTENDGAYDWTVTGPVSCNCVLKIEPLNDLSKATTQGLFTIASTTSPTATVSGVPGNPTNQTDATLTVSGDAIISYKYRLDGGEYSSETLVANPISLTDLADGSHTIYVLGRDAAGDWQTEPTTATWTVDTVSPTAIISGTPGSPTIQTSATITVSGEDVTHYKYKLDSGTYGDEIAVGEPISLSGLTDGSHTLYVIGRDLAENWQTEATTATWIVDTIPPTATISGTPSSPTNQTGATLTVGGEGVTHYKYKLDDGTYGAETAIATPITLAGLTDGSHTIYVIGRDAAGNWQSEASATTGSWTVETVPPAVTGLSDDPTPAQSKPWTWDVTDLSSVIFRYAIDQNPTWTPTGTYSSTKTATKEGGDGTWYIHVQAKDAAGNESAVTTVSAILDNTPPTATISGTPPDPTNQTGAALTVGGTDVTHYKYRLDDGAYGSQIVVATPITLSSLSDGSHVLYTLGRDNAGNWQTEATTVTWTIDTIPPTVSISGEPSSPTNSTSATLNINGEGVTHYEYKLNSGTYGDEIAVNEPIFLSGLSDGSHTLYVIGRDLAGNWQTEASPTTASWTVLTTLIITATSGPGGTMTPSGSVTVAYSADQVFTITPEMGYQVSNVQVDSASVGTATTYTFTNVTANHTIEAAFSTLSAEIIYVEPGGNCGGKSPCVNSIQMGIDCSTDGATVNIAEGTYDEDIILDEPKELILLGGWDAASTSQSSYTTANALIIRKGKIVTYNLVLKPLIEASSEGPTR